MGKGVGREELGLAVGRGRRGEFDLCLQSYHVGRRGIDGVLETCKCDAIVEPSPNFLKRGGEQIKI